MIWRLRLRFQSFALMPISASQSGMMQRLRCFCRCPLCFFFDMTCWQATGVATDEASGQRLQDIIPIQSLMLAKLQTAEERRNSQS
eukprot:symbB.v1.2.036421.t1/scaffold5137.1/size30495/2